MGQDIADVTIHIDENLDGPQLETLASVLRQQQGVRSVSSHEARPHLVLVKYDPAHTTSQTILTSVTDRGYHAELLGL